MSSWQNHYFQRGVSHGVQDGLERSFIVCCGHLRWWIYFWSVLWVLWCISPMPAPASPFASWLSMGWSVLVSVLGIFSVPGPTTHTKMIFVSTLVTFVAPCWAFSQWVRCAAFAACLILGCTLGSVAITFFKFEHLDLINHCCCCNSSIGSCVGWSLLLSSHAPWHVGEGLCMWCPLSSFFDLTHLFYFKIVLLHEKATLSYVTIFSALSIGTGIFLPDTFKQLIKLVSCIIFSMPGVALYISSMWFQ